MLVRVSGTSTAPVRVLRARLDGLMKALSGERRRQLLLTAMEALAQLQGHLQGWMILGFRSSPCFPLTPAGILVVSRPRGAPPLQLKFHGIYEVLLSLFQADTQSRSRAGVNSCAAALIDAGCNDKALRI